MTKKTRKGGRRTKKLEDELCEWLSDGLTLRAFCREKKLAWKTVYLWMEKDTDFAARIARAREIGEEAITDEMQEIADSRDRTDADDVQHRKLQLWMREKRLTWSNPAKYGQRTQVDQNVTHRLVEMTELERVTRVKQLLAKAGQQVVQVEIGEAQPEEGDGALDAHRSKGGKSHE